MTSSDAECCSAMPYFGFDLVGYALSFVLYWAAMRNSPVPAATIGEQEPVEAV
jgi:hypothetical protein